MKKLLFAVGVTLSWIIVLLISAELFLRICRPQALMPSRYTMDNNVGMIPAPDRHGRVFLPGNYDYQFSHGPEGFRRVPGAAPQYRLTGSFKNLLILGDSFTYGVGVNDDETFSARIQKSFLTENQPLRVVNRGAESSGTDFALRLFEAEGQRLKPVKTILLFCHNDFIDNQFQYHLKVRPDGRIETVALQTDFPLLNSYKRTRWLRESTLYNGLLSRSHFVNFINLRYVNYLNRNTKLGNPIRAEPDIAGMTRSSNARNTELTRIFLRRLNEQVTRSQGSLTVFYIAERLAVEHYRATRLWSADEQVLKKILQDEKIPYISLTPVLADSGLSNTQLFFMEGHWTAAAHALVADILLKDVQGGP